MVRWRAEDVGEVDAAMDDARRGVASLLVVEGRPGVGKSSLLRNAVERAQDFGTLVIESAESDREPLSTLAHGGVVLPAPTPPLIAAEAVRTTLEANADTRPSLLAVDDVQWADRTTVEAVVRLLEGAEGERLLIALATHPLAPGAHPDLQEFIDTRPTRHVVLGGLDLDAAKELARAEYPELDAETVERIWRITDRNLLYFTSVLREHDAEELSRSAFLPAPETFTRTVVRRLDRLGPNAAAFMRASAVLGPEWQPVATVAALADASPPGDAVRALVAGGLLEHRASAELGGSVRAVHQLVRIAVYQHLDVHERRDLHLAAATLADSDDVALAHRVAAADTFDEDLATSLAAVAARNHDAGAFRRAADQYRWSSRLSADPVVRRERLLDGLFEQAFTEDVAGVEQELGRLQREGDDRVALVSGAQATLENRYADALKRLEPLVAKPVEATDPLVRYRGEVIGAFAGIGAGIPTDQVVANLERARATGVEDPGLFGYRAMTELQLGGRLGGPEGFRAYAATLPESPAEVPMDASFVLLSRAFARLGDGDGPRAVGDLTEVERRFHLGAIDIADGVTHAALGMAYWLCGDWRLAEVKFRTAQRMQRRIVNPMNAGLIAIGRSAAGDFSGADALLAAARERLIRQPWMEALAAYVYALSIRLHAGADPEEQARALDELERDFGVGPIAPDWRLLPVWAMYRVPLAIWAGRLDEAEERIDLLMKDPGRPPWIHAAALWLRGLIAERAGRPGQARRSIADALQRGLEGAPQLRAHVLADLARIDGDAAARQRALEAYRELGQVPYVERLGASSVADSSSAAGAAASPSARPVVLDALSDRERDVLSLLVAGLSYAQIAKDLFISRSTVGFHLSRIYAKTGVSSRHALIALMRADPA